MKVHSKILSADHAYAFFSGGWKTFNWNGKMVRPLCYALVQEEKNQGPECQIVLGNLLSIFQWVLCDWTRNCRMLMILNGRQVKMAPLWRSNQVMFKELHVSTLWKSQNFKFVFQGASEGSGAGSGGPYIERITNDAREDEMEENMQAVSGMLEIPQQI